MEWIRLLLELLAGICGVFLIVSMLYQIAVGFFGFGKSDKGYADHDPQSRFTIFILSPTTAPTERRKRREAWAPGSSKRGRNRRMPRRESPSP